MSDDDVFSAGICQHIRRNLACVGTLLLKIHILGTDVDAAALCSFYSRQNVDSRYAQNDVGGIALVGNKRL